MYLKPLEGSDNMFGKLGIPELVLIGGIALVIFGPSKLPEIGKAFGQGINQFKSNVKGTSEDNKDEEREA